MSGRHGAPEDEQWVRDDLGSVSRADLLRDVRSWGAAAGASGISRVAVDVRAGRDLVKALAFGVLHDLDVIVHGEGVPPAAVLALRPQALIAYGPDATQGQFTAVDGALPGRPGAAGVWVFSSGTTGSPKSTHWPWASVVPNGLIEPGSAPERWGLGYAPFTFAAVSAVGQALGRAGRIEFLRPQDLAADPRRDDALEVVAATPSFWRTAALHALRSGGLRTVRTASTGGEPVDDTLLEVLRTVVNVQRIVQIFGTSEFGALFVVTDGKPGFPVEMIGERLPSGAAVDVREGRLLISPSEGLPFVATGDTAAVNDGRVHVTGRESLVINVGGRKVSPQVVSQTLQRHPGVFAARAYAVRSSLMGHVVGVDVVPLAPDAPPGLAADIKSYARQHLAPHERPHRVRLVDRLALAASGKVRVDE